MFVTVSYGKVSGRARQYRYWQPAVYEKVNRKKDGLPVYKYLFHVGTARRSERLAYQDAIAISERYRYTYKPGIRNNERCLTTIPTL